MIDPNRQVSHEIARRVVYLSLIFSVEQIAEYCKMPIEEVNACIEYWANLPVYGKSIIDDVRDLLS